MTNLLKSAALAATIAAVALTAPAVAQRGAAAAPAGTVVAVADVDVAVQQSAAWASATAQIRTTYAPQIANLEARRTALQTQLQTLGQTVQTEQARTPANQTAVNNAITAYQNAERAAQAELQQLSAPIDQSVAYVREQISLRLSEAVRTAATARRVDIVLTDGAAIWQADATNINTEIVRELNRLVPTVQIVPPAGYQPGALIRAAQQQAQGAAPAAPAPAAAQPQSR
jgi:Skp family chaperone for outer membrane proteins